MAARSPSSLLPSRAVVARVRRYIVEHDLISPGSRVLAAVSGGPDSTALLLLLAALRRSLRFDLVAAYFDHGLRGARAAMREQGAVRALCERLDVPFRSGTGDVRAHASARRLSIEEAARELRYRYVARAARAARCAGVAVGHTRDDQAETVLMHLLRGSGLHGLAGMAARAPWPVAPRNHPRAMPTLVRPLLAMSRNDTQRVCEEAGVMPLHDPSNRSPAFLRNRIRHELLPVLRRYNPRIEDALARLAQSAAADVFLLERIAGEAMTDETMDPAEPRLNRRRFAQLSPSLQGHAVRHAASLVLGDRRGLGERHVRAIIRASKGPTGATLDLPRRLSVRVDRDTLEFSIRTPSPTRRLPGKEVPLTVPGSARIGAWHVQAAFRTKPPSDLASDGLTAFLDADACGTHLGLRRRRNGDRFQPLGLSGPKKLQDFFVDAHVPREQRGALPLLVGERGIAWVVGQRPAEWAKIARHTRLAIWVRAECRPP